MKQILIAFVAATVLLALEDALARQCRNLLWGGILPRCWAAWGCSQRAL